MAKVFAGEANERERKDFEEWSKQNRENEKLTDMLKKNWEAAGNDPRKGQSPEKISVDVDKAWSRLHGRLEKDQLIPRKTRTVRMNFLPRTLQYAAAAVLLIAAGTIATMVLSPGSRDVQMTARTLDRQQFGLTLPDGSTVDLNTGSELKYRLQRSGIREVELEGEAFFDVRSDPQRPFIIRSGEAVVQVTGTSFSVHNDPQTNRIEVYVESGNVQFYRSRKKDRILSLKAGQMGVMENNRIREKTDIEPNHLSWKTRKLTFRETRLGDVAGVLNRTYNQEILFSSKSLEDCLFTGTFDQQPIDSVVLVIQVAFDLELDRRGRDYVFSGEGCN